MYIFTQNPRKMLFGMALLMCSILVHYFIKNVNNEFLEVDTCPFCYGNDYCHVFDNSDITFSNLTFGERLSNLINVKNVYVAHHKGKKVILKKLAHNWELKNIDKILSEVQDPVENSLSCTEHCSKDFTANIIEYFTSENELVDFKICSLPAIYKFTDLLFALNPHLNTSFMTATLWTTILANVEPLLLQILNAKQHWPVPQYFGACGRVIVEEHCGRSLNSIKYESWITRATLAVDLLQAAYNFTNKHPTFRFYLTDISPDNVVVTDEYKIKFIDLENMIITEKHSSLATLMPHESINFECESYAFSQDDICSHSISDHNYYSVCKLLLSVKAPWPMMRHGLLHSPPKHVQQNYPELFNLIEICADSSENLKRPEAAERLIKLLQLIIENE